MKSKTIAVLPFVNIGANADYEYFSDGITEELINALAKIENLRVISRKSSFQFRNQDISLQEIARRLGVSIILEGSVRVSGQTVRITAKLIEAEADAYYWSESWDRKLDNIFQVQDEISLLIAEMLREHLGHFEIAEHLVVQPTQNLEAYQLALKARHHFNKWNPDDVRLAIDSYEKALLLDPAYVNALVGLADAYGFMATTEFMPREATWEKSVACTNKAFQLNPLDAGVHYQRANQSFFIHRDFRASGKYALKAVELKPNYPEAQQYMAFLYLLGGDEQRAAVHLRAALEIDPINQETLFYKAYFLYRTGATEEALAQLDDSLRVNAKNIPVLVVKFYCLLKLDRFQALTQLLDTIPEGMLLPDERLGIRCLAAIGMRDDAQATACLTKLSAAARAAEAFIAHSYLFMALAFSGHFDEAFEWLEAALPKKSSIFLLSYSDPLLDGLKADPRYAQYHQILYPDFGAEATLIEQKNTLLDPATAETFAKRLLQFVDQEHPYLNPELSLRTLAEQVQIHPNQLSWLLNEHLGQNFNEFVNTHRVAYFKTLAKDPANHHISMLGLAYESGFNSKTAFNTFFKKAEGMTPSDFLKREG